MIPRKVMAQGEGYALSAAQQRLWFLEKMAPHSAIYSIPQALSIHGLLDVKRMKTAVRHMVERHPILRTVYQEDEQLNEVKQYIHPVPPDLVHFISMDTVIPDMREQQAKEMIAKLAAIPFNIDGGHLFTAHLFELKDTQHILFLNFHHSIIDGWSMGIFWKELLAHYQEQAEHLPELSIHYHDFAEWEKQHHSEAARQHLLYWTDYLQGTSMVRLDHDLSGTIDPAMHQGGIGERSIPSSTSRRIIEYCQAQEVTPYLFFMTAFHLLLHKYTGEYDITTGTPTSGRIHTETHNLIGFFVDMMAIRTQISEEQSFHDHLALVKQNVITCMDHQAVSFEQIVQALQPERELAASPLFQLTFAYQQEGEMPAMEQLRLELFPVDNHTSKYDISVFVGLQNDQSFHIVCEYNSALYSADRIAQFLDHYEQLVVQIMADPGMPVSDLQIITLQQQSRLLNASSYFPDAPHTFLSFKDRFEYYAQTTPDQTALVIDDREYTYAELNSKANRIAACLQKNNIRHGEFVGVHFARSEKSIMAILGIMKAGAAYVPLDPAYPAERLIYMVDKAGLQYIVSDQTSQIFSDHISLLSMEQLLNETEYPAAPQPIHLLPEDTAYMIFTSGSTGAPKGVVIEHGSLSNLIDAQQTVFDLHSDERVLQFASLSFDASVWEMVMALGHGSTLCMLPSDWKDMQQDMISLFNRYKITIATFPSSFLVNMYPEELPSLRKVIVAGERCPVELAGRWAASKLFWNAYGPSETTVCATVFPYVAGSRVPIGYPLPNMQAYVLDEQKRPVPPGRSGELYIGGVGLAREYFADAAQTAAKFIHYPIGDNDQRLYRTGDIVKYDNQGVLEFIDRIDNQVKIRGYRVELGEIEHQLSLVAGIRETVVICLERPNQTAELTAYIVCDVRGAVNRMDIMDSLNGRLPSYMIPANIIELEHMPLTPNGKIDKKQLPLPVVMNEPVPGTDIQRDLTPAEQQLVAACEKVLKRTVRITDHFFESGGDSILVLKLINELKTLQWSLTPRSFYQYPVLEALAQKMQPLVEQCLEPETEHEWFSLSPMQNWFFEQQFADAHHWNYSLLFKMPLHVEPEIIEQALYRLYRQHDAMRLQFHYTAEGMRQSYRQHGAIPLHIVDQPAGCSISEFMQDTGAFHQQSLNLSDCLITAVLMRNTEHKQQHLLLVVHHLLTDWVTGGIIAEDLNQFVEEALEDRENRLPSFSLSFKSWIDYLSRHTLQQPVQQDLPYWQMTEHSQRLVPSVPLDRPDGINLKGTVKHVTIALTMEQTNDLIRISHYHLNSDVKTVLLSTVLYAIRAWSGMESIALDMASHGRHDLWEEVDITRTAGWLTSVYPLVLQSKGQQTLTEYIYHVQQAIQLVPHEGITYGMLRYYAAEQRLDGYNSEIWFNYFGHNHSLDNSPNTENKAPLLELCDDLLGSMNSYQQQRSHVFEILGMIREGQLHLGWQYSEQLHNRETIQQLADHVYTELAQLIAELKETYIK
ncbi:non-ribosomal peptide synthetase [Paenibacillus wulumuqiensis]|uniref:non-ribosomal peptide synthetase n=1 Tax=Paenibacillus wulumuqiensis TaxID=1567107 RepID=UPI000619E009|nr:non-ribosomal peptide synthetase [Paenibacillus wulumuqiensis]